MSEFDKISIDDVEKANRVLDAWREAEWRAHEKALREMKRGR